MWPSRTASIASTDAGTAGEDMESSRSIVDGIAQGIRIVGDIRGDSDLSISGQVSGSVFLPGHRVVVGIAGKVKADITSRVIEVMGTVQGDLRASERVTIRKTSHVQGDIVSPQIELEEGCQFKGSVRMQKPETDQVSRTKPKVVGDPGAVRVKSAAG